jgi:hypothetical protein
LIDIASRGPTVRSFGEHELADRCREPGMIDDRHEVVRVQHAAPRMVPPQQRLEPEHIARRGVEDRLVVHCELVIVECGSQVGFEFQPIVGAVAHLLVEHGDAPPAGPLGRVHRQVCLLHQL